MNFLEQLHTFINQTKIEYTITNNCYYFAQFNFIIVPMPIVHTLSAITCGSRGRVKSITQITKDNNVDILYLYEDRWFHKNRDIKSRILTRLGMFKSLFARKCTLLTSQEWLENSSLVEPEPFASQHHSYGAVKSKHKYALVYNGEVVAAAYFSSSRPMIRLLSSPYKNILPQNRGKCFIINKIAGVTQNITNTTQNNIIGASKYLKEYNNIAIEYASYEWLRYVSEPHVRVVGAMGRLLKAFINDINRDNINLYTKNYIEVMSYSDTEWSGGNAYARLGFVEVSGKLPVEYFICKDSFKRNSAKVLLKLYNNTFAESNSCNCIGDLPNYYLSKFYRIKNMGSKKFLLHFY